MIDPYIGREQTRAKHYILRRYLQALAFKVLTFSDVAYIDGFSGPWESRTEDFSDSSFMIAISVLKDAQRRIFETTHKLKRIRCFFCETDGKAFAHLEKAVTSFHEPSNGFEVKLHHGKFEEAVADAVAFTGNAFPLIFIDPTGWTGYPFETLRPLFAPRKCEVVINFMYEFVNRFSNSDDATTIESLNPILGGPGWRTRLDSGLARGDAVAKLFHETLKTAGGFEFLVSARIDKATADRPHYFITYATKNLEGLKTFRQTEYDALREHERVRAHARTRKRNDVSGMNDMFSDHDDAESERMVERSIDAQLDLASDALLRLLSSGGELSFDQLVARLLELFMLRETNVRDICVSLAKSGQIESTWHGRTRKPQSRDVIRLKGA